MAEKTNQFQLKASIQNLQKIMKKGPLAVFSNKSDQQMKEQNNCLKMKTCPTHR
jgi:hypothetical protein